jgi:mono/diheme cytochrome c family protein
VIRSARLWLLVAVCGLPLLVGCRHLAPPKPLEQLTPAEAQGHAVFQAHCAQCHYDRETGPLHGPSLLGVLQKPYLPSGAPANDDRITATVMHGRGMMPAQLNMDDQELQDLLRYLHTL